MLLSKPLAKYRYSSYRKKTAQWKLGETGNPEKEVCFNFCAPEQWSTRLGGLCTNHSSSSIWGCSGGLRQLTTVAVTEPSRLKCCCNSDCMWSCNRCMQQSHGFTAPLEANAVSAKNQVMLLLAKLYIRLYNEPRNTFLLSWFWHSYHLKYFNTLLGPLQFTFCDAGVWIPCPIFQHPIQIAVPIVESQSTIH
jgi:hypothetical protein